MWPKSSAASARAAPSTDSTPSKAGQRTRSAQLDERHPELVEGALQLSVVGLEFVAQTLDEGGHGVDGQGGLGQVGLLLPAGGGLPFQVEGGQLEQRHGVPADV